MKNLSLKRILGLILLLLIIFLILDILFNWEEAVEAFYKGYNDMNVIQENRSKKYKKLHFIEWSFFMLLIFKIFDFFSDFFVSFS